MPTFNPIFSRPSFPIFSSPSSHTSLVKKPKCTSFKLKMPLSQFVSNGAISSSPSKLKLIGDEKIKQVESIEEFDELLASSHNELTLVAFAPNHVYYTRKILYFLRELSKIRNNNARFLYVVGDGSRSLEELCQRENVISKVPIFGFYKGMQKIHQIQGLEFDQLTCDVLYYSENYGNIVQLYTKDDFDKLIRDSKSNDHRLIVVLVGLKHCGPCARVYPTLLQMSKMDSTTAVFARMDGDENDSCKEFLKDMNVVEVPTFLFAKNGQICGRYSKYNVLVRTLPIKDPMVRLAEHIFFICEAIEQEDMECLRIAMREKVSPKSDIVRLLRSRNIQKATTTTRMTSLEAIAQLSNRAGGGNVVVSHDENGVMKVKIIVKKQDLKQVVEQLTKKGNSNDHHRSSVSLEQRISLVHRKHVRGGYGSKASCRSSCLWRPALQSIPEEL